MRYSWLNQDNNDNLIVFMNGWGMDKDAVKHLDCSGYDILELNDYRDFNIDFAEFNLNFYKKKYLTAWSMGVYIANIFKDVFKSFDKKTAIAGTNKIIDNKFGIPCKIYNYTVKFFRDESAKKFIDNIFQDEKINIEIKKTTNELKEELISIQNLKTDYELEYDKIIIPKNDTIIPYQNQLNYWSNKNSEIQEINSAHYVFNKYKTWQDIIC